MDSPAKSLAKSTEIPALMATEVELMVKSDGCEYVPVAFVNCGSSLMELESALERCFHSKKVIGLELDGCLNIGSVVGKYMLLSESIK